MHDQIRAVFDAQKKPGNDLTTQVWNRHLDRLCAEVLEVVDANRAGDLLAVEIEYQVCRADGYPDPVRFGSLDSAQDFQRRHGGIITWRYASPWEDLEP